MEENELARRSNIDICADILKVARGGANKTRIVYQANLNFKLVKDYLRRLVDRGLIEASERLFVTTPKGVQFIEQYSHLINS
jgi:predicted transcriptional regulator